MLKKIKKDLNDSANPVQAKILQRFFKTGLNQYGAGDVFLGLKVPTTRRIVAKHFQNLNLTEIKDLLESNIHEYRLAACLILVKKYEITKDQKLKQQIVDFYLANLDRINNWDLVDLSAPKILGHFLLHKKDRNLLYDLAKKDHLWSQRVAIIATYTLIKDGQFEDTLKLSRLLLTHSHDLIHKAVGWMLRELGKKNQTLLEGFLLENYKNMSRTTLRYAIEKLAEPKRKFYLKAKNLCKGFVIKGLGNGQSRAYATVNFSPDIFPQNLPRGIYAAWVLLGEQRYRGALFFGPRKVIKEEQDVLEIHILDFQDDLYHKEVLFDIQNFIREVLPFASFADLKKQITADIQAIESCLID